MNKTNQSIAALAGGPSEARYSWAQNRGSQEILFAQTPVLNIGYEDNGNSQGFPVILLHGFLRVEGDAVEELRRVGQANVYLKQVVF